MRSLYNKCVVRFAKTKKVNLNKNIYERFNKLTKVLLMDIKYLFYNH